MMFEQELPQFRRYGRLFEHALGRFGPPPGVDGQSFAPQVRGEKGQPRESIYCWYASEGGAKADKEFAANQRYKLYRTGKLYDYYQADPAETRPLPAGALGEGRNTNRHNRKYRYPSDQPAITSDG